TRARQSGAVITRSNRCSLSIARNVALRPPATWPVRSAGSTREGRSSRPEADPHMRIALDAMGGDLAPGPNVEGAIAAVAENPDLQILLVGDPRLLEDKLAKSGYSGKAIEILGSEGVAGMDEKPTEALLKKPKCSIAICWKLMAGKEVDAVVSAGSTGAVVAAGLRTRLFL